ncbi:MAG: DnaB-like helicase C-terminal domain-containing protein [Sphaerochaeta sp.]
MELTEKNDFIVYDEANVPLNRLIAVCHDAKKYYNVQAIFIDYIQIIRHHNDRLPRHEQAAEVSKALKQLARDLDLPVVCASQLRRDAEGKKPQLADMSDSTQLERDADIVMAIYNIPNEGNQSTYGRGAYVCLRTQEP